MQPRKGGNVADARGARIAPGEHARERQGLSRRPAGQGVAQRRRAVGRPRQRLAHDRGSVGCAGGHEQGVDGTESRHARGIGQRRRQRAGRHLRAAGAPVALTRGARDDAQPVTRPDLHHDVGGLIGDPAPDVAALGPVGVVEEAVDRRKPARSGPSLRRRLGHRQGAHRPARALLPGRLGLEPPHRVEHDSRRRLGIAVEPAHEHDAALGPREVEGRRILEGEQRRLVAGHPGRAHDTRLARERRESVERRPQVRRAVRSRLDRRRRRAAPRTACRGDSPGRGPRPGCRPRRLRRDRLADLGATRDLATGRRRERQQRRDDRRRGPREPPSAVGPSPRSCGRLDRHRRPRLGTEPPERSTHGQLPASQNMHPGPEPRPVGISETTARVSKSSRIMIVGGRGNRKTSSQKSARTCHRSPRPA